MTDRPLFIQPPKLTWAYIQEKADEFRKKYVKPSEKIPVPIDKIAEIDLRLQPILIHNLLNKIDIDGFLTKDLKNICFDYDLYCDERRENRLRFTYAHEVGHLILHENELKQCAFRDQYEWIHFHEDFLSDDLNWFENQAREFAGRLLVPKTQLISELEQQRDNIIKYRSK